MFLKEFGGFNSIVVRLKGLGPKAGRPPGRCFNSIVVRLKGDIPVSALAGYIEFQFHSGSIKRETGDDGATVVGPRFNSIVVRLKAMREIEQ